MASTVGRLGFLVGANTNAFDKALVGVQRRIDRFKKQGVGGLARRLGGFARSMAGTSWSSDVRRRLAPENGLGSSSHPATAK